MLKHLIFSIPLQEWFITYYSFTYHSFTKVAEFEMSANRLTEAILCVCVCVLLGLELRAYILSHSASPFCEGFFQDRVL
jgi:hypothetical protein